MTDCYTFNAKVSFAIEKVCLREYPLQVGKEKKEKKKITAYFLA